MACPTHRYADVVVATADGRIDFAGAQELEAAIASALVADSGVRGLVIDFSKVDYISSVGLRVLMMASRQMRARGARIATAALQPVVREIFEIARFQHVVEIFPTLRDALAALSPAALAACDAESAPRQP